MMRHFLPFAFAVLTVLFLPGSSARADHGVFSPETFFLNNGMQVVVVPNHRVPVVTHMVWYKVGAADEPLGKSGMAHFFEHLMFKGTHDYPDDTFSRTVARNGGQENAFTSRDYTAYFQTVAKDRLELMMTLEADRMTHLTLTPEQVEQERQVILEERRQRTDNNPASILREHVDAALFMNHPYRRPVVGWEHEVRALTLDDLRSFYKQWYTPANAILVVAGDITAAELRPMAERTYGRIPSDPAVERVRASEPPHRADRRVEMRDARVRQPSWSRTYLAPSHHAGSHDDVYALEVLVDLLGGGATSPLYKALVVDGKLAVSAGAHYNGDAMGPGTLTIYASPRPGVSLDALETAVDAVLKDFLEHGVSEQGVQRTIRRMQAEAVFARDSLSTGARVLGASLASGLTVEEVEAWPHRIAAVTPDAARAVGAKVLEGTVSVTARLLPENGEAKP